MNILFTILMIKPNNNNKYLIIPQKRGCLATRTTRKPTRRPVIGSRRAEVKAGASQCALCWLAARGPFLSADWLGRRREGRRCWGAAGAGPWGARGKRLPALPPRRAHKGSEGPGAALWAGLGRPHCFLSAWATKRLCPGRGVPGGAPGSSGHTTKGPCGVSGPPSSSGQLNSELCSFKRVPLPEWVGKKPWSEVAYPSGRRGWM